METRDIVLSLLIVLVGVGIFYLLDPTMAGLLNKHTEGFASQAYAPAPFVLNESDATAPGVGPAPLMTQNGSGEVAAIQDNIHAISGSSGEPARVEPNRSKTTVEGFNTLTPAPMPFKDAEKPANCYPKDQINPQELLPNDPNSKWAQVNPMGQGDIAGKNYLSAGALIGVNTIGQSLRNANYQLRSDPPNPQVKVSIWNQSTIEPDANRRSLEIA
jgi:hypothetical protein